jgi:hypothetical protein
MIAVRLLGALLILIVGASLVVGFLTRDPRWKRFAWKTARAGIIILLIFMALYALERLVLVV